MKLRLLDTVNSFTKYLVQLLYSCQRKAAGILRTVPIQPSFEDDQGFILAQLPSNYQDLTCQGKHSLWRRGWHELSGTNLIPRAAHLILYSKAQNIALCSRVDAQSHLSSALGEWNSHFKSYHTVSSIKAGQCLTSLYLFCKYYEEVLCLTTNGEV